MHEIHALNAEGKKTNVIDYYNVKRTIRINSNNVVGLKKQERQLYDLIAEGISISVSGPEFFVTSLDDIKLQLMKEATENGKKRASVMAESSGEKLGSLVSAKQGGIQITKRNST